MLVGLTGPSGVGKDYTAQVYERDHGFTHLKFCTGLRALTYLVTGANLDLMGDKDYEYGYSEGGQTIQEWLLDLGAEARAVDTLIFCLTLHYQMSRVDGPWVVSDVRQPNELAYIQGLGGKVYEVVRDRPTARPMQPLDGLLKGLPTLPSGQVLYDIHHIETPPGPSRESLVKLYDRVIDGIGEEVMQIVDVRRGV